MPLLNDMLSSLLLAPINLSIVEEFLPSRFQKSGSDYAHIPDNRISSSAFGWVLYRPAAKTVFADSRNGIYARRAVAIVDGSEFHHDPLSRGASGHGLLGLAP